MIDSKLDFDGVELMEPNGDTWLAILLDALVCTFLFIVATATSGAFITAVVEPFVPLRRGLLYLPIWLIFMLIVPYYARWRGRLRFRTIDLVWWCPALIALTAAMEIFSTSSIIVPLTFFAAYFFSMYLRAKLRKKNEAPN